MICAYCRSNTTEAPCGVCARSPLLAGRYRLVSVASDEEDVVTFLAEDSRRSGDATIVRRIALRRVAAEEVAARLDRVLAPLGGLHHPGIPRYKRAITAMTQDGEAVWVARDLVDGPSLAEAIARHGAHPLRVTLDIVEGVLELLVLLGDLEPPLPHGDLRPGNIRVRPGGRVAILGFGALRAALEDPGFPRRRLRPEPAGLAPEQRSGECTIPADLYAVGALAAGLLTGLAPAKLQREGRIAWEHHVRLPGELGAFLDRLVDPAPARRPASARVALAELHALRGRLPDGAEALALDEPFHEADELPTTMMSPVDPELLAVGAASARRPPGGSAPDDEPTTMGPRPTAAALRAVERVDLVPPPVGRAGFAEEPRTGSGKPVRPTGRASLSEGPPTGSAPRPDLSSPFAVRASDIENTAPRPATLVRPPTTPAEREKGVFSNSVFIAVGLAVLGIAFIQVLLLLAS